jgi:hypothetical protein
MHWEKIDSRDAPTKRLGERVMAGWMLARHTLYIKKMFTNNKCEKIIKQNINNSYDPHQ